MKVNEIFVSLSGEPDGFDTQGGLATFVRLQGCNLNCTWCDTKYASGDTEGEEIPAEEVAGCCQTKHVIITGGEPLLQLKEVIRLAVLLTGYDVTRHLVTIETNGSIPITIDIPRTRYEHLRFVVDYKLNSSGMHGCMKPEIFDDLYSLDVIKFVIANLTDYQQAKELVWKNPQWRAKKVFSPLMPGGYPKLLAKAMIEDKLEGVTFALQWHKILKIR